jgi:hypothetical protein
MIRRIYGLGTPPQRLQYQTFTGDDFVEIHPLPSKNLLAQEVLQLITSSQLVGKMRQFTPLKT